MHPFLSARILSARKSRRWVTTAAATLPMALLLASCTTEAPQNTPGGQATPTSGSGSTNGQPATAAFESPRKPEGRVFIKIVTNGISPFWDPMGVGMERAATELGFDADWSGPESSNVADQKRMVEDALAKGADGIALSCIEAEAAIPIIDMVLEKGVPVITFDADSPNSRRLCYIGTNNFNAGRAAGEAAAKLLPQGGKFVGFVGNISAQNARERRDGFVDAAKAAGIELVEVFDDNKSAARARANVESAISRYGSDVQGFLGLFSYNGPAIAQAVGSANLRSNYKVLTFDAEPVTLQELEKGNIDGAVVQEPYQFGYLAAKLLYLVNRKGWSEAAKELNIPADGMYDTGVRVITPENVKQYKEDLAKLGIKSS